MSFFKKLFSSDKKETSLSEEVKVSLDKGLEQSKTTFFTKLTKAVAGKTKVDADVLDNLEEILISSDVGVNTTLKIIERIENYVSENKYLGTDELNEILRNEIASLLSETNSGEATQFEIPTTTKPYVLMVVGVNGVGKTTTIGKLAYQFKKQGFNVVLGAADTFRAAAVDQLVTWGARVGVEVVTGKHEGEPAAVAFDATKRGVELGVDYVVIDTAGRLHTKNDLMAELGKIKRVIEKTAPVAEVLLVIDGTTGQNGLIQAKLFSESVDVTGLIVTKLDGTARGGVALAIEDQLDLPIKFIGTGEAIEDFAPFDSQGYIDGLLRD